MPRPSPVEIAGRVDDARLAQLYREAPCVVAPAYEEDYGLTAVEAMRFGTPVVVCRDGGGLASIVRDGFDGLVVDPDGPSIAAAVDRICSDDDLRGRRSAGAPWPPRPPSPGGGPPTSSGPAWRGVRAGMMRVGEDRHRRPEPGAVHPGRRRAGVGRAGSARSTS